MSKVIVIDDDRTMRELCKTVLQNLTQVLESENGQEGLELVRRERPEAVVLDLMMPGEMDGLDVLAAIRSDSSLRDTFIIITGRDDVETREQALQLGANAYFIKPFSVITLVSLIRTRLSVV
jgi:DNA-binding response OmpR family regulator